jgi:hypothetical protein
MRKRDGGRSKGSALARSSLASLALTSATLVAGCLNVSPDAAEQSFQSPDYELGGQTGSLIPGCGVAPLSADGQSVPAGRELAVFYAQDCPELVAPGRLALSGIVVDEQQLELVRLGDATYLLRSAQSLPAGDYQLEPAAGGSELRVDEAEVAVPSVFGTLSAPTEQCPDVLRFTLALDDAALALAPLARFEFRLDGGEQQLWVDYGALRIERDEAGNRGVLELPSCTAESCLSPGPHQLELHVRVAGQSSVPEPLLLDFEVCPSPVSAPDGDSDEGCALVAPGGSRPTLVGLGGLGVALGLWRRRGIRRS